MGLSAAAGTAIAAGVSAAAALGTTGLNYAASQGMSRKAREENFQYNEQAAENALRRWRSQQDYLYQLQSRLYNEFESPTSYIRQLREAGLSPSIFANGGAGGGVSGVSQAGSPPQGNGANGLQANYVPMRPIEAAEVANLMANARLTNTKTDEMLGITEKGQLQIQDLILQNYGKELANTYSNFQNQIAKVKLAYEEPYNEANVRKLENEANNAAIIGQKLSWELVSSFAKAQMDIEDMKIHAREIEARVRNSELEIPLKITQNKVMQAQIRNLDASSRKMIAEIEQNWAEISIGMMNVMVNSYNADTQRQFVKNMGEYWDKTIDQMEKRLEFDKDKLDKEMRYKYVSLVEDIYKQVMQNGTELMSNIIPLAIKK